MPPIRSKLALLLSLTLISMSLVSCNNEINRNEYIIGYAGTFDLNDVSGYATVQASINAYNFDAPEELRSSINGEGLGYYTQDIGFAHTMENFTMDEGAFIELNVEYNGRTTKFSGHIMPELSYDKISLEGLDSTSNEITLSWIDIEGADYYSIDIESDYNYSAIVWDTLVVTQNQIKFDKNFFQQFYGGLKVNITAVQGPLPSEENYYNLEGEIAGRFLLISGSYVRTYGRVEKSNKKLDNSSQSKLVIENIMSRYY